VVQALVFVILLLFLSWWYGLDTVCKTNTQYSGWYCGPLLSSVRRSSLADQQVRFAGVANTTGGDVAPQSQQFTTVAPIENSAGNITDVAVSAPQQAQKQPGAVGSGAGASTAQPQVEVAHVVVGHLDRCPCCSNS
jgi:hypothetical protein